MTSPWKNSADEAYLNAVQRVLLYGTRKPNRTGVDTISTFNVNYDIDLTDGFPLLTTKKVSWKNIVVEMLWFLSGQTDIGILKKHGCGFWDAWADTQGRVPSAYGNFWRRFPTHGYRDSSDMSVDGDLCPSYNDQLAWIQKTLRNNPMSRRMVVSAWAPGNAQTSKLPPCHCLFVFNVQLDEFGNKRLCCHLTQRSCDMALGVPYNIASYALLTFLFSRFSGIPVGEFGHTLIDAHIYTKNAFGQLPNKPDGEPYSELCDHVPGLKEQLTRKARPLPKLEIDPSIKDLSDIRPLLEADTKTVLEHFKLVDYNPHPAIKFEAAI